MSTLILAFANSETNRLKTLDKEYQGVTDALRDRHASKDFDVIADQILNRDKMAKDIRSNEADICLFLFSGHAGRDQLVFDDGAGNAEGIAALLGRCPALKLVILNGCSTKGQVNLLLEKKVPIVIATSAPIDDKKATEFSITFFKELANHQSIREAFNRGLDQAKVFGKIQQVEVKTRSMFSTNENADEPLWGMYYNPEDEALLDTWRLPINEAPFQSDEINQDITDALKAIAGKEQGSDSVLLQLPFIISEPIRKLSASRTELNEPNQFFDTPSWERFQMILYAYRAIINLTTYTLLAELWDKKLRDPYRLELSEECRAHIETALFDERTDDLTYSNLSLLQMLIQIWSEADEPSFLSEIKDLETNLNDEDVKNALMDLESKIADQDRLERAGSSETYLLRLCRQAELSFANVLYAFRFWVNYSLTSIKDIELLKFRHRETSYRHQVVPVRIRIVNTDSEDKHQAPVSQPLDTSSIMLRRWRNLQSNELKNLSLDGLNLSPFLIDKNALIKASSKADLHYLLSFSPEQNFFCYRKATSYRSEWLIQPEKELVKKKGFLPRPMEEETDQASFYTLLKDQCASFCQAVLNKSLSEL